MFVRPELSIKMPASLPGREENQYTVIDLACFGSWPFDYREPKSPDVKREAAFLYELSYHHLDFLLLPTEIMLGVHNARKLALDLVCGQRQRLALSAPNTVVFGVAFDKSKTRFFGSFVDTDSGEVRILE